MIGTGMDSGLVPHANRYDLLVNNLVNTQQHTGRLMVDGGW